MNIVIMTAPPRTTDTLKASLVGANVVECIDTERRGSFYNAITALTVGVASAGPFALLQDDVQPCRNFVPYLERLSASVEREGWMIDLFDVELPRQPTDHPVFIWRGGEEFYYSQAVLYSSQMAQKILKFLVEHAIPASQKDDRGQTHGDDMWIRAALRESREAFLVHLPSLVQHIGGESLVAPGMRLEQYQRISRNFIGTDFDVMKWPRII